MRIVSYIRWVVALLVLAQVPSSLFGMGEVVLCRSAVGHEEIEVKHAKPCSDGFDVVEEGYLESTQDGIGFDDGHCVDEPLGFELLTHQKKRDALVLSPVIVLYSVAVSAEYVAPLFVAPVYVFSPDSVESLVGNISLQI